MNMDIRTTARLFSFFLILLFVHPTSASSSDDTYYDYPGNDPSDVVTAAYTGLATWIIVVIVIVCLIVVAIIVSIIVCCVCCARSATRRPVTGQVLQAPGTMVVTTATTQQTAAPAWEMNQGGINNPNFPTQPNQPQPDPTNYPQTAPPGYKQ